MQKFKLFNFLRIKKQRRTIHTGIGYDMGDGVDIEDIVLEFGTHPKIWLTVLLGIKITTHKNEYIYTKMSGKYIWKKL